MAHVLVVDDEPGVRSFLSEALRTEGHQVAEAADGREALRMVQARAYHVIVTDLRMPQLDGLGLLAQLREHHPHSEVIVLTAHGSVESAVHAMKLGAFDYVQKPISSPAELRLLVQRALERHRLQAAREAATPALPPLSYGSAAMAEVERALGRVARTDATVLLIGESGTGKELAALTVHQQSPRAGGPFVAVNCAALSEQLLESELFGHERGAFTGANARRRGRLELADGGTFFLDEIGELQPALQAKLLRVLQERRFERVGGNQSVASDVRWIAATNRNLEAMLEQGRFREDLFHRLAVFPVRLPPLRERRDDIAPLARALLARIGAELGRPALTLTDEACHVLERGEWGGNVRQLANALERAAILADHDELGAASLGLDGIGATLPGAATRASAPPAAAPHGISQDLPPSMADAEQRAIHHALEHFEGNRRKAAEHLGIGLRTLYDKIKRYGLD